MVSNHWFESQDYLHFPIHVNPIMHVFPEGEPVRVVVAAEDPQWPGWYWLDTTGHVQGIINVRFVDAAPQPMPKTRLVSIASAPVEHL